MGIKSLNEIINKFSSYTRIHLSHFAYKKVAIDTSLFVYKYKYSSGENWISSFVNMLVSLRRNEIHCVFIFDSKAPDEKIEEQQRRRETKDKDREKIELIIQSYENFKSSGKIDDILLELYERITKKEEKKRVKLLLPIRENKDENKEEDVEFDISIIHDYIEKSKSRLVKILDEDFDKIKELLLCFGIPYFLAPQEAECFCSDLCKRGIVDAVLTDDTDVLAYGANIFLSKLDISNDECDMIEYKEMLEELDMKYEEFLDMCILCGTDYNKNIEGIGTLRAYELIKRHKSIENFEEYLSQTDVKLLKKYEKNLVGREISEILDYKKIRCLFTNYITNDKEISVNYCDKPNWEKVKLFLAKNNCNISIKSIEYAFSEPEIIFID